MMFIIAIVGESVIRGTTDFLMRNAYVLPTEKL